MTATDTRALWQRTWVRVAGSIAALALVGGAGAVGTALASPHAVTTRPAANTAPVHLKAPKAARRPDQSTPAANSAVPARYATDILQAGITAPVAWINSTGQKIVADWSAGDTATWIDANVLTPNGAATPTTSSSSS